VVEDPYHSWLRSYYVVGDWRGSSRVDTSPYRKMIFNGAVATTAGAMPAIKEVTNDE